MQLLLNVLGVGLTWAVWLWLAVQTLPPAISLGMAAGGALLAIPIGLFGRRWLDRQPDVAHAERVTTVVHYALGVCLGGALVEAIKFGLTSDSWLVPVPPWLGISLMLVAGLGVLLAAANLALKGRGAPFAIALTRVVAADWMYAWTRNPMVLSALAFLIGLGLWLQSGLFLVWVILVAGPAMLIWLSVYEERELEIRFGPAYLEYKARTPLLWPRPPQGPKSG